MYGQKHHRGGTYMDGQKLNEAIENTVRPKKEELAFLSNYVVNFAIMDL